MKAYNPYSITLSHEFAGIRAENGYLCSVQWGIDIEVQAVGTTQHAANVAISKVQHFFDICMSNIVMVAIKDTDSINCVNYTENPFMLLPGQPNDDLISRLLYIKLGNIMGKDLGIVSIALTASDHTVTYNVNDKIYEGLPITMLDFVGNGVLSLYEQPWWERSDGFTTELLVDVKDDVTPEEMYGDVEDPMESLMAYIESSMTDANERPARKKPAKVEKFNKWNPKPV